MGPANTRLKLPGRPAPALAIIVGNRLRRGERAGPRQSTAQLRGFRSWVWEGFHTRSVNWINDTVKKPQPGNSPGPKPGDNPYHYMVVHVDGPQVRLELAGGLCLQLRVVQDEAAYE